MGTIYAIDKVSKNYKLKVKYQKSDSNINSENGT